MPALKLKTQEDFAQHVAAGMSQAKAYQLAYPEAKTWAGILANSARLRKMPSVEKRIQEIRKAARKTASKSKEDLIQYLEWILDSDAREVLDEDDPRIESVEYNENGKKYKLFSKAQAAKMLADLQGFNAPEKKEVSVTGIPDLESALDNLFSKPSA